MDTCYLRFFAKLKNLKTLQKRNFLILLHTHLVRAVKKCDLF